MSEERANLYQVYDYRNSARTVIINFKENSLEVKYFVKTEEDLKVFLENLDYYIEEIKNIKQHLKFKFITCRFDFGKQNISKEDMKKLIDFQHKAFDEITIQKIKGNNIFFQEMLSYAFENYELHISTLTDIKTDIQNLKETIEIIQNFIPSNSKWLYGRFDKYINNYRLIKEEIKHKNISIGLTACPKRYSVRDLQNEDVKNLSVSAIARSSVFSFDVCCLEYNPVLSRTKKIKFIPKTDIINPKRYVWEIDENKKNFVDERLNNFKKHNAMDLSQTATSRQREFQLVINHLSKLMDKSNQ